MADFSRKLYLASAVSAICASLAGCGAGSNNLSDPVSDTPTSTTCGANAGLCITGQFVDEPVSGLNYECDTVRNVTTAEGYFNCPNNSVVTFFLQAENGKRKITLGTMKVSALVISVYDPVSGKNKLEPQLLQVSPLNMVEDGDRLDNLDALDLSTTKAVNIMRLLQALASPGAQFPAPSGRIHISEDIKSHIDTLTEDVGSGVFNSTVQTDSTLKPFLDKAAITLPTVAAAKARFLTNYRIVHAGLYEATPQVFSIPRLGEADLESGMVGQKGAAAADGVADKAIEAVLMLIDRENKSVSLGLEWRSLINPKTTDDKIPKSVSDLRFKTTPVDLQQASDSLGFSLSGKINTGINFIVQDVNSATPQGQIKITKGVSQHGYITSHPFIYRSLFGLSESAKVPEEYIGEWERIENDGSASYKGTMNLERKRRFDPLLDPAGWKTLDTIKPGERPVFPLHIRMKLRDNDVSALSGCSAQGGCTVGSIGVTILPNGNIVSDMNNDCGLLDAGLVDGSGQQEYRLGTVSALFMLNNRYFISPVMLFTKIPGWEQYYGTLLGAAGRKARIDISGVLNGSISMLTFEPNPKDTSKLSDGPAEWLNYPRTLRLQQTQPVDLTADLPKAQGIVSEIALQACYNPQPKI